MAGYLDVRAYAELNDFLAPESRGTTVRRPFRSHQTVKDVLEAMGIPHTEVDLILVNGRLARLLRILGFDVWWSSDADDQLLADISVDQNRILLTRDRGLLKRRAITHGLF